MSKSGLVAASVAAASATAILASSPSIKTHFPREDDSSRKTSENSGSQGSSSPDKFAPRFDGLRFIETLVTAHR
ncbi:hypothetical protein CDL12_27644 [Handroanthus impetiginosus]|uniref:Uncharacterized protein n=1 Tax=Handroanthus impetiginosus TaxID=429701 RepID=A0A2G9G3F2_9LAMI|nr:hypothetical protein CDL12_27644 [Handroanthus impetiginosus]